MPLSISFEKAIRLSFLYDNLIFEPDVYLKHSNGELVSDEDIELQIEPQWAKFKQEENHKKEIINSIERDFQFLSIDELLEYTKKCHSSICLNIKLYENLIYLLELNKIDLITDILDKLKEMKDE